MEAAGSVNARLAVLNQEAANITQVVTTITKVADQTNLLSLNAADRATTPSVPGAAGRILAEQNVRNSVSHRFASRVGSSR
jgi:methyl-accepting chemotaxis protein WspA